MTKDYYKIAQVHPEAEIRVIEKLRRVLASIYHPDHAEESKKKEYNELMKEMNEAIDLLTDPQKRLKYNQSHPYFKNQSNNQDFGPLYRYKHQFDIQLHPYLDSDFLLALSSRAKKLDKLNPHVRKHLYYIGKRIQANMELTEWQKGVISLFINQAKKEGLIQE